jgi:hypothetical protein
MVLIILFIVKIDQEELMSRMFTELALLPSNGPTIPAASVDRLDDQLCVT